ncbi:MAG: ATP-dependent Clp protease ATP-binding subunit, partial [Firmicutes bacterium]|nr:ATP-dependent Clp protease ATP-binding subunit [Bacillota bacterium]
MENIKYTKKAAMALDYSKIISCEKGNGFVGTEHILMGMLRVEDSVASSVLLERNVTEEGIQKALSDMGITMKRESVYRSPEFTPRARRILDKAVRETSKIQFKEIGTGHILLALLDDHDNLANKVLKNMNVEIPKLMDELQEILNDSAETLEKYKSCFYNNNDKSVLAKYGRDYTDIASKNGFDPIIGREREI